MDWMLFWTAFGAIGTTLGSFITASAVIVAVKQYKQPLKKIVKVELTSAVSCDEIGNILTFYCIAVKNKGVRPVQIHSICIKGNKKNLWINNAQFDSNAKVLLPVEIKTEECKEFLFEVSNFIGGVKKGVNEKILQKNKKLVVFVTDSLGEHYFCKTNIRISDLIKNI